MNIDSQNPKFYHSKGLVYEAEQKDMQGEDAIPYRKKAIEMYQRALFLSDNKFVSSQFHLGKMYHLTNQFNLALKCMSNVASELGEDKSVYIARGQIY